jgi:hypothetical protein
VTLVNLRGWLRENERLALRRWCLGQDVLELGPYEGLSTVNIAVTANGLVTVDTFDGRGTPEPKDTEQILWNNLEAMGSERCPVQIHKGTFAEVLPRLDRKFDRIFLDGSHDYESVQQDIQLCLPLLKPKGRLLFHDYCTQHPGVVQAVDELVAGGATPVAQADTLIMVQVDPLDEPKEYPVKVMVAMPHRDGWACYGAVMSAMRASQRYERSIGDRGHSLLTLTFNQLWCEALNLRDTEGYTHFAMLHNDVVPEPYWVDILMDEMVAHDLDCISCLIPLKNEHGLTSTATDTPGYPWGIRRLTMTEAMQLPETFTANDVPYRQPDAGLLLNTGCWLIKLNEPWVKGLHFRQQDRIVWCRATQTWAAQSISEDWDFSRQLVARGCRLGATRKVKLYHQIPQYNNTTTWGDWTQDEEFLRGEAETAKLKELEGREAHESDSQSAVPSPDVL